MEGLEYGKCDMCGNIAYLQRKYYNFDIKCECHGDEHFEIVSYCKDCVPIIPPTTEIKLYDEATERSKTFTIDTENLKLILTNYYLW